MIDIQLLRENPDKVQENAKNKGYEIDVYAVVELDKDHRNLLVAVEELRKQRNKINAEMKGKKPTDDQLATAKVLKEQLQQKESELAPVQARLETELKRIPNIALDEVPVGKSEDENVVIRTFGERPEFDFEPKPHWKIAEEKGWMDKERAVRVAGSRFLYLKGDLVRLEFALMQFGLKILTDESVISQIAHEAGLKVSTKPFIPVIPPAMARTEVYEATGRLNKEEQTYKLADDDLWLNASAEHTLSPMYLGEILEDRELPIRLVGHTTAFRREAGTYGKDTEGMLRLHQFNKLEMESFTNQDDSYNEHLLMVAIQEYLMSQLGLHFQTVEKCTADIGGPNAKGIDIDVWLPGEGKFRETHTADYITDYQCRRMNTRVRRDDGQLEIAHTNDATAYSQRPLIAIIEQFQQADGSVIVPSVLREFLGKNSI